MGSTSASVISSAAGSIVVRPPRSLGQAHSWAPQPTLLSPAFPLAQKVLGLRSLQPYPPDARLAVDDQPKKDQALEGLATFKADALTKSSSSEEKENIGI